MKKEAKTESKPSGQKARERTSTDDLTALRIRVAELCGWKNIRQRSTGEWQGESKADFLGTREIWFESLIPNFHLDLNACHEFEKMLTSDEQKDGYYDGLCDVIIGGSSFRFTDSFSLLHATAEQRCRAFVKVMEGRSVVNRNENQGQDQGKQKDVETEALEKKDAPSDGTHVRQNALLPCPFCGYPHPPLELGNIYEENFKYQCLDCKATTGRWRTREAAKNAWNKRAAISVYDGGGSSASYSPKSSSVEPSKAGNVETGNALKEICSALRRVQGEMACITKPYDLPTVEAMRQLSYGMLQAIEAPLLRAERFLSEHATKSDSASGSAEGERE